MTKSDKGMLQRIGCGVLVATVVIGSLVLYWIYTEFRIDVPAGHIGVLTKLTGENLENNQSVAPDNTYKGLQLQVVNEGRHFYNPYTWDWKVYPMVEIPAGKMGVRIRLYGDNLPYGHFLATKDTQKGVVEDVLRPGRYAINALVKGEEEKRKQGREKLKEDYVELIELYDPINISGGYRGIVTNLAGPIPENPNSLISEKNFRGVQRETLGEGTYYVNPYMHRVNLVDCRSQKLTLGEIVEMGFPSRDGFWIRLDGIIEFRVKPEKAAEVFVKFNENKNDKDLDCNIDEELIRKLIAPTARSFCRLKGSNSTGREFIGGETRTAFQKEFQIAMQKDCEPEGIEIVQALITKIHPPEPIAKPVRDREVARQKLKQYDEQKLQQEAEAKLAIEKALIIQRQELVAADQIVMQKTTAAMQEQKVAITKAMENKAVAERDLKASEHLAAAILSKKKAEAGIINFANEADAAGWKKSIEALGGDGDSFARYVMMKKLAPSYKSIMTNTADSPLMDIFKNFSTHPKPGPANKDEAPVKLPEPKK